MSSLQKQVRDLEKDLRERSEPVEEQAEALATLIVAGEHEGGWAGDRLLPLVAGLPETLPWVRQWRGEFDPEWAASPAGIYDCFLAETTNRRHLTDEALTSWRPAKACGYKAKA